MRNYFEEKSKQADHLYEIKLLLVGEERAGKSSLANALTDPDYVFTEKKSTEGIDISRWDIPSAEIKLSKDFRVNVWDFGGQEIYHATHQFFLTKRSLYFFVTEARKDLRQDDCYYWLNVIDSLGDRSPVVLVLNKCDQPHVHLPFLEIQKNFPHVRDYLPVSCKDDRRATIQDLKNLTIEILRDHGVLPDVGVL